MAKGRTRKELFSVVEIGETMIVRERRQLCGRLRMVDRPLSLHAGGFYQADDKDQATYEANRWDLARKARRLLSPAELARGKRKYDLAQDKTWSGIEEKDVVFSIVKSDDSIVVREKRWVDGVLCDIERRLSLFEGGIWRASAEDKALNEDRRREVVRKARGLPTPAEIASIRTTTGLSQRALSGRLAGSLSAFQKYEAGNAVPCKPMAALLKLLGKHPELIAEV
jgi:DNA-binding transcriptional regulator YiaG